MVTVEVTLISFILAAIIGLVLALLRMSGGAVGWTAAAVVELIRSTPLLIQIFFVFFVLPRFGIVLDAFTAGVIALSLHYGAYCSEVYRAGIESVHPSQDAAARSLGLSRGQSLRYVVVPQAVRRVIPPLLNDFIGLQKDTALVALIGPVEAFRQAQIDTSATFNFTPYVAAALIFVAFTIPLARLTDYLNERSRRRRLAAGIAA